MRSHAGVQDAASAMRDLHSTYCLCGEPGNDLLSVPDVVLLYLSSILQNDQVRPPECSPEIWRLFLRHLYPHQATPILYWYLRAWDRECLPPAEVMEIIRRDYLVGRVHSIQIDRQLGEILAAAEDRGIRMLILKGSALARSLYPDPAMRGGSDIDVLVSPDQMEETESLLTGLGYRCGEKKFAISRNYYYEETFYPNGRGQGRVAVDVHWRCTPSLGFALPIPSEELFARAVTVSTDRLAFETLAPRDAFLHTALHMVVGHTRNVRLTWIHDTALLAGRLGVPEDWSAVRAASRVWGVRNAVEIALAMAQVWTGFIPPPGYDDFTGWPPPSAREEAIWADLLKRDASSSRYLKLRLSTLPDRREKIRVLRYLAGRHLRNWFR